MINILAEMELADNFKNKEYFEYWKRFTATF